LFSEVVAKWLALLMSEMMLGIFSADELILLCLCLTKQCIDQVNKLVGFTNLCWRHFALHSPACVKGLELSGVHVLKSY